MEHQESELAKRFKEVIGEESVSAFGRRCGIGEATIRKYLKGTLPNVENLVAIADAANVSVEWLAAGRGPKQRGGGGMVMSMGMATAGVSFTDTQKLARAIRAVQEGLATIKRPLPPEKHAQLIEAAYELICEDEGNSDRLTKVIQLVA